MRLGIPYFVSFLCGLFVGFGSRGEEVKEVRMVNGRPLTSHASTKVSQSELTKDKQKERVLHARIKISDIEDSFY